MINLSATVYKERATSTNYIILAYSSKKRDINNIRNWLKYYNKIKKDYNNDKNRDKKFKWIITDIK